MKHLPRTRALLCTALLLAPFASAKDADAPKLPPAAPPQEYILEIDGQPFPITADTPAKLKIGDKEVVARLIPKPDRLFKTPGLSFRIPAQHAYEFDDSTPGMKQWTFDGNDNVLIVTRVEENADGADLVKSTIDGIIPQFGRQNIRQDKSELALGGKKYPAVRMTVTLAGQSLQYQIASMTSGKSTFLIMVQDSLKDDGTLSDEAKSVLNLLDKTLKLEE
jgi:hypothetical protein